MHVVSLSRETTICSSSFDNFQRFRQNELSLTTRKIHLFRSSCRLVSLSEISERNEDSLTAWFTAINKSVSSSSGRCSMVQPLRSRQLFSHTRSRVIEFILRRNKQILMSDVSGDSFMPLYCNIIVAEMQCTCRAYAEHATI